MAEVKKQNQPAQWKLAELHNLAIFTGSSVPVIFALAMIIFPKTFSIFINPAFTGVLMLVMSTIHVILSVLEKKTGDKRYYTASRWAWIVFWIALMYVTGGVHTLFLFLLTFPILVAVADIDLEATKRVAFVVTAGFGILIFFDPASLQSTPDVVGHVTRTILFAVIAYYLYTIVKDTINYKVEREQAKKEALELVELDKIKSGFVEVASHQLRSPLSGARWALSSILEKKHKLTDDDLALIHGVSEEVQKAIDIVNEMLTTAEYDNVGKVIEKKSLNLNKIVSAVVVDLQSLVQKKGVSLHFKQVPDCALFEGDERLIKSAFSSVVDNAVRYSPKGDVYIEISCDDTNVNIAVRDTGMGISSEDLPYMFERFYRGKNAISLEPNESGIGLYITKKIIDYHLGEIKIDSKMGEGTTVLITLPQKRGQAPVAHK